MSNGYSTILPTKPANCVVLVPEEVHVPVYGAHTEPKTISLVALAPYLLLDSGRTVTAVDGRPLVEVASVAASIQR